MWSKLSCLVVSGLFNPVCSRYPAANEEVRQIQDGEIDRRTRPQATAIFSMARMSAPLPIFRGLRYYIHKTVPRSVFGWLRSLLIVSRNQPVYRWPKMAS